MSNMTYCQFRNTLGDLYDLRDSMEDRLSKEEAEARTELIKLCREIADYDEDVLSRYVNDEATA